MTTGWNRATRPVAKYYEWTGGGPIEAFPLERPTINVHRMKFWQLTALLKARPDSIIDAAQSQPEWQKFGAWLAALDELCDTQDRKKLDEELPNDFVRAALSTVDMPFYVTSDGWIHLGRHHDTVECLSALDAFNRFGGEVLEDAQEKGCSHRKLFQTRP